jgi:hypothetical protein
MASTMMMRVGPPAASASAASRGRRRVLAVAQRSTAAEEDQPAASQPRKRRRGPPRELFLGGGSSDAAAAAPKTPPSSAAAANAATPARRRRTNSGNNDNPNPADREARALTRRLSLCGSSSELAELVATSSAQMNARHAAAALHALSRCAEREGLLLLQTPTSATSTTAESRARAAAAARVLLGVFDRALPSASAADLAVALGAAARLRIRPPPPPPQRRGRKNDNTTTNTFVDRVLARALSLDPRECSGRDLAMLLWAAARLGHGAAPGAVAAMQVADPLGALSSSSAGGGGGGQRAELFPKPETGEDDDTGDEDDQQQQPQEGAPAWMAALMEELLSRHDALSPFELAVLPWSAAKLGFLPPQAWLRRYWAALCGGTAAASAEAAAGGAKPAVAPATPSTTPTRSRIPELGPSHLAMLLWAAAALPARPPQNVLDALMLEAHVKMPGFNARGLASLGWALARLDARPAAVWRGDYVRALRAALPGMRGSDQAYANSAWALASWRHGPPPRGFCEEFCAGAAGELSGAEPRALAALVASVADWLPPPSAGAGSGGGGVGCVPPIEWPTRALRRMAQARSRAGAQDVVLALDGGARLVAAAAAAAADGEAAVLAAWRAENAATVQALAQALMPALRPPPRAAGIYGRGGGRAATTTTPKPSPLAPPQPRLSPPELVAVASALAALGHFPGEAFMDAHEAAVNAERLELDARDVRALRDAYAALERAAAAAAEGGGGSAGSAAAAGGKGGGAASAAVSSLGAEDEEGGRYI